MEKLPHKPIKCTTFLPLVGNVEAMTSKGLRASCMSKYTEIGASYNVELLAKPLLVIACVIWRFYCQTFKI